MSVYETDDIYIAALLLATENITFLGCQQESQGRMVFTFQEAATCKNLVTRYMSASVMVNAKRFADSLKSVKDMLFSEKRSSA